jgi:hypothetical protein
VVEDLAASVAPVVEDLTAPHNPVAEDLTAPLAPVVEDLAVALAGPSSPALQSPGLPSGTLPADVGSSVAVDLPQPVGHQGSLAGWAMSDPFSPFVTSTLLLSASLSVSGAGAASPSGSAPGAVSSSAPPPSSAPPLPAPSGATAGSGAAGVAASTFFALFLSLVAFGLRHFTRVCLVAAAWRTQAFGAVIERPG